MSRRDVHPSQEREGNDGSVLRTAVEERNDGKRSLPYSGILEVNRRDLLQEWRGCQWIGIKFSVDCQRIYLSMRISTHPISYS